MLNCRAIPSDPLFGYLFKHNVCVCVFPLSRYWHFVSLTILSNRQILQNHNSMFQIYKNIFTFRYKQLKLGFSFSLPQLLDFIQQLGFLNASTGLEFQDEMAGFVPKIQKSRLKESRGRESPALQNFPFSRNFFFYESILSVSEKFADFRVTLSYLMPIGNYSFPVLPELDAV